MQPRHITAANAFCKIRTHMRVDTISQSSLLQGIRSRNVDALQVETGGLVSPLSNEFGHSCFPPNEQRMQYMVAERVAYYVNASQELEVNKKDICDKVINEISCSADYGILDYARNYPEKVAEDVERALATSEALRPNQNAARQYNLQAKINAAVTQLQHRAFLSGTGWRVVKPVARGYLISGFTGNDDYGRHHPNLVTRSVDQALRKLRPEYNLHREGARFKAFKAKWDPRLDATQIRSASGKVYALINTSTLEQANRIWLQHGAAVTWGLKTVIGQGGFGKVRYALDLESGEILAVKKFSSHRSAKKEWRALKSMGFGPRFVDGRDYAHVRVKAGAGASSQKSYIFTTLANLGDGKRAMGFLRYLQASDLLVAKQYFRTMAREYSGAVADMHARGVYHHDIKPDNFLHSSVTVRDLITGQLRIQQQIKIADYGLANRNELSRRNTDGSYKHVGGTNGYFPPEGGAGPQYKSSKHDAFSLGITLLEMKLGMHPRYASGPHLSLPGGATLKYCFGANGNCYDYKVYGNSPDFNLLPLDSEDNIIARLLHFDPNLRITPHVAYEGFRTLLWWLRPSDRILGAMRRDC